MTPFSFLFYKKTRRVRVLPNLSFAVAVNKIKRSLRFFFFSLFDCQCRHSADDCVRREKRTKARTTLDDDVVFDIPLFNISLMHRIRKKKEDEERKKRLLRNKKWIDYMYTRRARRKKRCEPKFEYIHAHAHRRSVNIF